MLAIEQPTTSHELILIAFLGVLFMMFMLNKLTVRDAKVQLRFESCLTADKNHVSPHYVQTTTRNISTPQIHLQQPALTCSAFHVALTNARSHTHTHPQSVNFEI